MLQGWAFLPPQGLQCGPRPSYLLGYAFPAHNTVEPQAITKQNSHEKEARGRSRSKSDLKKTLYRQQMKLF